jgi:hypothetical protein
MGAIDDLELCARRPDGGTKPSNPKDVLGIRKVAISCIPWTVIWELGIAMLEGALKYGRHNYRAVGVRASVYFDAAVNRHLAAWWEGEDTDEESQINHVTKAIACLTVLRDSMIRGNWVDDRPPRSDPGMIRRMNDKVAALLSRYPEPVAPYTQKLHPGAGWSMVADRCPDAVPEGVKGRSEGHA